MRYAWNKGTKGICKPNSGSFKKIYTEEQLREHRRTYQRNYARLHKEENSKQWKKYYKNNLKKLLIKKKEYHSLPEIIKKFTIKRIFRTYGLTEDNLNEMYKKQDGKCCICQTQITFNGLKSLNIDHDHKSGKVRGLLCRKCNRGIGHFNDDITLLKSAIKYLNKYL